MMMRLRVSFFVFFMLGLGQTHSGAAIAQTSQVTPAHVFQITEEALVELDSILEHQDLYFNRHINKPPERQPRHVWQKSREVIVKLQAYQKMSGLEVFKTPQLTVKVVMPSDVKMLAEQILDAMRIMKRNYGVSAPDAVVSFSTRKTPTDVYLNLTKISAKLDFLFGNAVTPSDVYHIAVTIRNILQNMHHVRAERALVPFASIPLKGKRPRDVYEAGFALQAKLKGLEKKPGYKIEGGIARVEVRGSRITPSEVLDLLDVVLADVNELARSIGIKGATALSPYEGKKIPTDVFRILREADALVETLL